MHVIKTPPEDAPLSSASVLGTGSTLLEQQEGGPGGAAAEPPWVLDVELVPGITYDGSHSADPTRRRFFWEGGNGLVEGIWEDVCAKGLPIRILGVEHR